jgi:hypothetical protein
MNHALLGAAFPFILAAALYVARGCRARMPMLVWTPLAMGFCALWAEVPDLPRLLGWHDLYLRWSVDPRMNLFFWHYHIDQVETESSWYAVGIALMAAALMIAALRQLFLEERS